MSPVREHPLKPVVRIAAAAISEAVFAIFMNPPKLFLANSTLGKSAVLW
jgi:hypothetical protein